MEDTPDYARYTWEQLQDALAHVNKEKYPANFAALGDEIEKRINEVPASEVVPQDFSITHPLSAVRPQTQAPPAQGGCLPAFLGWLCGSVVGVIEAFISYMSTITHMKAVGNIAYQRDDVGFALIGLVVGYGLAGGIVGLILGLTLWWRTTTRR